MKKDNLTMLVYKASQKSLKLKSLYILYVIVFVQVTTIVLGLFILLKAALFD